jgi:hypothetical protein
MNKRCLLQTLFLGLALCACAEPDPGAAARIELAETAFNAGRVRQGTRIEHAFAFRNAGGHDLRVTRVRPSCGCTAALI